MADAELTKRLVKILNELEERFAQGTMSLREMTALVRAGEHQMGMLGWTGDNGDPDNFFVPLAGIVGCGTFGLGLACAVPRDWYFALWAAVVGSIVGLTIRLVLERRRFEHGTVVGS